MQYCVKLKRKKLDLYYFYTTDPNILIFALKILRILFYKLKNITKNVSDSANRTWYHDTLTDVSRERIHFYLKE